MARKQRATNCIDTGWGFVPNPSRKLKDLTNGVKRLNVRRTGRRLKKLSGHTVFVPFFGPRPGSKDTIAYAEEARLNVIESDPLYKDDEVTKIWADKVRKEQEERKEKAVKRESRRMVINKPLTPHQQRIDKAYNALPVDARKWLDNQDSKVRIGILNRMVTGD